MPRLPFQKPRLVAGTMLFTTFVLLGSSNSLVFAGTGCPGDITGNHIANVEDLLTVINSWGPCSGCDADVSGNNMVNVDDLLDVLNNWGPCTCTAGNGCFSGLGLWCEDFELGNYSRWTGDYSSDNSCDITGFAADKSVTPSHSNKSAVVCATPNSHRGYGGLRFQGDLMLPSFTIPSTGGINAPNGAVITFWSWLKTPYTFDTTKWLSLMTVTSDCSNNWNDVITLNIDDSSMKLKPVHVTTVTYAPNAPSFPLQQWNRTTVYINYNTGQMHVWQNGQKVVSATFSRPVHTMCQWHWGLYASGPNDNVVLYEDDIHIVKLLEPLTNFTAEPWFDDVVTVCGALP